MSEYRKYESLHLGFVIVDLICDDIYFAHFTNLVISL